MTLKLTLYLLPKFSRVPFTIVLISRISTMVKGSMLNFGKRYEDDLRVIFDQWPKLYLGLDERFGRNYIYCSESQKCKKNVKKNRLNCQK